MVHNYSVEVLLLTSVAITIHLAYGSVNDCNEDIVKISDMGMPLIHKVDYVSASCGVEMFDWRCNYYDKADIADTLSNCSSADGIHVNITTSIVCDNGYFVQGTYITGPWCVPNSCNTDEIISNKMWDLQEGATANGCEFNFTAVVPSASPTLTLSDAPSLTLSMHPSVMPTYIKSGSPTLSYPPSAVLSNSPSVLPSGVPTINPRLHPTSFSTNTPHIQLSASPTIIPTVSVSETSSSSRLSRTIIDSKLVLILCQDTVT